MGNEDGDAKDSQLWMYMGTKTKTGTWFEKAGLTNGKSYVLAATASAPVANDYEIREKYGKNKPFAVTFAAVDIKANGKAQNIEANAKGIELARVEDGHFDPNKPNDFYFVTTQSDSDPEKKVVVGATTPNPATPSVSRDGGALWRLRFVDVNKPFLGSTLELLLDGSEDIYMSKPDNITVDALGNVLIQEDPGNNAHLARIVSYRISDGKVGTIAQFKADYFTESGTAFITRDEESSGIVEVSSELRTSKTDKASYFMFVAQIHATPAKARPDMDATDATLAKAVEGGQWYILKITNWTDVYK
jgi:secreted PhoX family phosphatase